jgi:hypothetical protein
LIKQTRYFFDAAPPLGFLKIIDLIADPKEREPINPVYYNSWVAVHAGRILKEFKESAAREPMIPAGSPVEYVPTKA